MLLAGNCARRRTYFLLVRQKKVGKEKAAPLAASLRFTAGNLRCSRAGCAAELTAHLRRSVQTAAASQITMRMHPAVHSLTPPAALLGASRGEWGPRRAIAALGLATLTPALSREREREEESRAERSDGPGGVLVPSGRAEKRRAWGVHGQRSMPMLRALTRCGSPSAAAQPRSEFRSAAPCPSIAGCPGAQRRGHGQRGRLFLWLLSFWRRK